MKILIVAATKEELAPLASKPDIRTGLNGLSTMPYGKLSIDLLFTGVGMTATAFFCGKFISGEYDLAINAGICGSFNNNLIPGTVVNIYEDRFAELGAEDGENFLGIGELGLPAIDVVRNERQNFSNEIIHELPKVTGITVNTTHGNEASIAKASNRFHPFTESMEGAAFMFACEMEGLPYLQLRAVSNLVERRNRDAWQIPLAIANLNEKLVQILDKFNENLHA